VQTVIGNRFTYPDILIIMKYKLQNKIFAIDTMNIKCLINHFHVVVVASFICIYVISTLY